jgi:hypothetical protein
MDEPLTHDHFVPHVGKRFSFEGHSLTLFLTSVDARPHHAGAGASRIPFTLAFEGPAGNILPAGHYRASVHNGPIFELHIMPIHTHVPDRQDYQAVFN